MAIQTGELRPWPPSGVRTRATCGPSDRPSPTFLFSQLDSWRRGPVPDLGGVDGWGGGGGRVLTLAVCLAEVAGDHRRRPLV